MSVCNFLNEVVTRLYGRIVVEGYDLNPNLLYMFKHTHQRNDTYGDVYLKRVKYMITIYESMRGAIGMLISTVCTTMVMSIISTVMEEEKFSMGAQVNSLYKIK